MMDQLKMLMLFRLLLLVIQLKKTSYNTKIAEIQKKILDHNQVKCITTQEFNKLTLDNFAARLALVISATKADIADIVKKTQNKYIVNIVIYYILYYCKKKRVN